MTVDAVIFDWGGVLTPSPLTAIRDYEQIHHLPKGYISVAIHAAGDDKGLFQRLERGELVLDEGFLRAFEAELTSTEAHLAYAKVGAHTYTHIYLSILSRSHSHSTLHTHTHTHTHIQVAEKLYGIKKLPPSFYPRKLDTRTLLRHIMKASAIVDEEMLAAVRALKRVKGIKRGLCVCVCVCVCVCMCVYTYHSRINERKSLSPCSLSHP